jgi:hypothetical protein
MLIINGRPVTEQAVLRPAEHAVNPQPERAVKPPGERRTRKRKVEHVADPDSAAGD